MMIENVTLENIKSHVSTTINFQEGINAIIGKQESGKSTIIEAIGFTLFQSLNYNHKDFLRHGCKTGKVIINVTIGDKRYKFVRTVGSNPEYYVEEKGERIVEQVKEISEWLKETLGIDKKVDLPTLWENIVSVPQGMHTSHFLLPPSSRKKIFDPILNVDIYPTIWKKLLGVINVSKDKIHELERVLTGKRSQVVGRDETVSRLDDQTNELDTVQRSLKRSKVNLSKIEKKKSSLETLKRQSERIPVIENDLRHLQRDRGTLKDGIDQIDSDRSELKKLQPKNEKFMTVQEELDNMITTDKVSVTNRIHSLDDQLSKLKKENREIEEALEEYEEVKRMSKDHTTLTAKIDIVRKDMNQSEGRLSQLEQYKEYVDDNKCPILNETCPKKNLQTVFNKMVVGEREESDRLETDLSKLSSEYNEVVGSVSKLSSLDRLRTRYQTNKQEISEMEKQLIQQRKLLKKAESDYTIRSRLVTEKSELLTHRNRYITLESRLNSENDLLRQYKDVLSKIDKNEEDLITLRESVKGHDIDELPIVMNKWNEFGSQVRSLETTERLTMERIVEYQKSLAEMKSIMDEITTLENEYDYRERLQDFIVDIRSTVQKVPENLLEHYLLNINFDANLIFNELNSEPGDIIWTNDYGIITDGEKFHQRSGGGQMVSALSMRLALLKNMTDIDLSFFDEPTINMDEEHRYELADMISNVEGFSQLFVISHDDSFDTVIENTIHITKLNDETIID